MRIVQRLLAGMRQSRLLTLLVVGASLAVLFVALSMAHGSRGTRADGEAPHREYQTGLEDARKVAGFVEAYGQRIDDAERRMSARDEELKEMREHSRKLEGIIAQLITELDRVRAGTDDNSPPGTEPGREPPLVIVPRLTRVQLSERRPGDGKSPRRLWLPAGSFVEATLLTGVYAPIEGGPLPVTLRVDAAFAGPNRSRVPIQGAFLLGRAEGEPNSQRVIVQLEKLSYAAPDGRSVDVGVNGYLADADGVQGMAGTYVWRMHETAAAAALTGGFSAAADAAAARETVTHATPLGGVTQAVTGDLGRFATSRGASRAAEAVEKALARRLEQIVPAVYVANGKRVTVVLLEGVALEGLTTADVLNERSRSPYAGLDLDR